MPQAEPIATGESHGARRRRQILAAAADASTAEGLEGLSLARLAAEIGLSKSGVAAHFGSKQALQLAVVDAAAEGYERDLIRAPAAEEPGLPRLRRMMAAWIDRIDRVEYRGGCFFAAAGSAFGARPGPVRDRIAAHTRGWIHALEREVRTAVRLGELRADVHPAAFAFRLHALVQEANLRRQLLGEDAAFDVARALLFEALQDAAPDSPVSPTEGDRP